MPRRRCPGCRGSRRPTALEARVGPMIDRIRVGLGPIERAASEVRAARDAGDAGMAAARERLVAAEMAFHATDDRERAEALADYAIASQDGTLF